jgi:hypothetical protein
MISSFCSGGDCAEVGKFVTGDAWGKFVAGDVWLRSSLDRGQLVVFTPDEWAAFVAGVKNGEFDLEALA